MTTMISRPSSPNLSRTTSRWRDPRLAMGIALVALCGLGGARLLAGADDHTLVWVAGRDLTAGATVTSADLRTTRIHFSSAGAASRYLAATDPISDGEVLTHDVAEGELLPASAVAAGNTVGLTALSLSVSGQNVPSTTSIGDSVDVWVAPTAVSDGLDGAASAATLALSAVRVISLPKVEGGFDPTAARQVVVGVDVGAQRPLAEVIGLLSNGSVVLTTPVKATAATTAAP